MHAELKKEVTRPHRHRKKRSQSQKNFSSRTVLAGKVITIVLLKCSSSATHMHVHTHIHKLAHTHTHTHTHILSLFTHIAVQDISETQEQDSISDETDEKVSTNVS